MTEERNIERTYRKLIQQNNSWRRLNSISYAIFYFGFNVLMYATFEGGTIFGAGYLVPTILAIAILYVGVRYQKKAKQLKLNSYEKLFLRFYGTADVLENYLDQKESKNKKIPISRLKNLSRYVSFWTSKKTPPTFRNVPESISNYLYSSISFVEINDEAKIKLLKTALYAIANNSMEKDPSFSDFEQFRNSLKNLTLPSSDTTDQSETTETLESSDKIFTTLQKYGDLLKSDPRTKFILIGIVSMIALLGSQSFIPPELNQIITTGIMGGIALMGFLLYLYDRSKKTDENKSNSNN